MNVEFLIHGTLSDGQSCWKKLDRLYCAKFYTENKNNELMMCEIVKQDNGTLSSYYSYLRYNNIEAKSGRTGSYFGMTVRIDDCLCSDVSNMYRIFENLFNKLIVGKILIPTSKYYMYQCNSFEECDIILKDVENSFVSLFTATFKSDNDFAPIPKSFTPKREREVNDYNIDDVSKAEFKGILLNGNILSVSKLFPSSKLVSYQKQMVQIQRNADEQIQKAQQNSDRLILEKNNECQKTISAISSSKEALQVEINNLKNELKRKETDLNSYRNEINKQKLNYEINHTVKDLNEPLSKLIGLLERIPPTRSINPSHGKNNNKSDNSIFKSWKFLIFPAIICLLTFLIIYNYSVINTQEEQITELTKKIKVSTEPINDIPQSSTDKESTRLKITIDGKDQPASISPNKEYILKIEGGNYPKDGIWKVNGEQLVTPKFKMKPGVREYLIEYCKKSGELIVSNSFQVQKS